MMGVAGLVVALVAVRRSIRLARRIDAIELEFVALERQMSPGATGPAGTEPSPDSEPFETEAETARPPTGTTSETGAEPAHAATSAAPPPTPPPVPAVATENPAEAPPPPPSRPTPPRRPAPSIEWERLLGVRGAAIAGGLVLALASVLLFKYSIEHGLIPPAVRVMAGLIGGLASVVGSEVLRGRRQPAASDALAGAGIVALYASVWAAFHLYHHIPLVPAFLAMAVITAACGMLAHRHESLVIAVLGLIGGFATPMLVAGDRDQPVALFTYLLLLNLGLLWLATRRHWPVVALLGLAGTAWYQVLWVPAQSAPGRAAVALVVLVAFGLLFALVSGRREWTGVWRLTSTAGLILPFLLAVTLARGTGLEIHPAPLSGLLVLLSAAACWLTVQRGEPALAVAAALLSVAVLAAWFLEHTTSGAGTWEAVASSVGLAATFFGAAEWARRRERPGLDLPDVLATTGVFAILALASWTTAVTELWPWLAGWFVCALLILRQAHRRSRPWLQLAAAPGVALALATFAVARGLAGGWPVPGSTLLAVMVTVAVLAQIPGVVRRPERLARWSDHAAATAAMLLVPGVLVLLDDRAMPEIAATAAIAVLGLLGLLAAARSRSGWWLVIAAGVSAFGQLVSGASLSVSIAAPSDFDLIVGLVVVFATAAVFTQWPGLAGPAFATTRLARIGAAVSAVFWFPALAMLWQELFGTEAIAVVPLALAALTLVAAQLAARQSALGGAVRQSALVWLLGVTLSLVSVAVPLQLEKQWITIGWALNGAALIALWRRLDHAGLKLFGLGLLGAATIRLVANPAVLSYLPRADLPVLNWVLYTYWVPIAALLASAWLLRDLEAERRRPWEPTLGDGRPLGRPACGLAAVIVLFAWLNLAIADVFGQGDRLELSFERLPARDVTTSVAWALFALGLLVIGVRTGSRGLRWGSLGLMVVTIAKVFLHDLGELEDLYRVASLLGLAVSLILVSLMYQRFVLSTPPDSDGPT